jgi:predicted aspartyl protease
MRAKGANGVGRVSVEFEIANYGDVIKARDGLLPSDQVRRLTIRGIVDSGAAKLVLPGAIVRQLGLPLMDKINVRHADGRTAQRREAEGAYVELLGRYGTFTAIVEPNRTSALIGAIVLEHLDLLVDCQRQRVVPRDPRGPSTKSNEPIPYLVGNLPAESGLDKAHSGASGSGIRAAARRPATPARPGDWGHRRLAYV